MSNGLLVFIEHKSGTANRSSIEAIAAAQALGSQLQQTVTAVVLGGLWRDGQMSIAPRSLSSR